MIVKVKEPLPPERQKLRRGQVLFTYLHLAPDRAQAEDLMAGVTAIAYETVTSPEGTLPLLTPMSEVAGRMAPQVGAHCLQKENGGRGVLLGGVPGVPPADLVKMRPMEIVARQTEGKMLMRTVVRLRPPQPELSTVRGGRKPNCAFRSREYLTELEIEKLRKAARKNRNPVRDELLILLAFRLMRWIRFVRTRFLPLLLLPLPARTGRGVAATF
jgi:hypothetical protein